MNASKKKIYIFGCTMWDIIGKPLEVISPGKDCSGMINEGPGGVAFNVAMGLSKFLTPNSFELNLAGYDFFVDGGCPVYLSDPDMRNFFRSTMNHNTLAIEDAEQDNWDNSYEGIFRLEEKSNPSLHFTSESIVIGSHSGFGNPHIRKFNLKNNELLIFDTINDKRKKFINFNLDAMVEVSDIRRTQDQIYFHLIHKAGMRVRLHVSNVDTYKIVDGAFSYGFGVSVKNKLLRFISTKYEITSTICWD